MLALQPEMPSSQGIDNGRQQQTLFRAGNCRIPSLVAEATGGMFRVLITLG
jgi:hypothetical protein